MCVWNCGSFHLPFLSDRVNVEALILQMTSLQLRLTRCCAWIACELKLAEAIHSARPSQNISLFDPLTLSCRPTTEVRLTRTQKWMGSTFLIHKLLCGQRKAETTGDGWDGPGWISQLLRSNPIHSPPFVFMLITRGFRFGYEAASPEGGRKCAVARSRSARWGAPLICHV